MRDFGSSSLSLGGSLLVSHPSLLDPNFRRTAIFLATHDAEEGSFGLVLNRPAGRSVSEVLVDQELGDLGNIPVFLGGPVATDQLVFASFRWNLAEQKMECRHHLVIEEVHEAIAEKQAVVRAFIGYAGWSKGQLEGELAQRAWLVAKADRETLRVSRTSTLWREVISGFGPLFQLLAEAPEDLSRN